MKKLLLIAVTLFILLSLISCGNETLSPESPDSPLDSGTLGIEIIDTTDYSPYLHKVWVLQDWNRNEDDRYPSDYFSFQITKIENGTLEGKLTLGYAATSNLYHPDLNPEPYRKKYWIDLSGTINNGVAECTFAGDGFNSEDFSCVAYRGKITLVFQDSNEIEATISYAEPEKQDGYVDGTHTLIPYNLIRHNLIGFYKLFFVADYVKDYVAERYSSLIDLDYWGDFYFVAVLDSGDKQGQSFYLTNEYYDVFYDFGSINVNFDLLSVCVENVDGTYELIPLEQVAASVPKELTSYEQVLDEYRYYLLNHFTWNSDKGPCPKLPTDNLAVARAHEDFGRMMTKENLVYALTDINGDGTDELVILSINGTIYAVYSLIDDKVYLLCDTQVRSPCRITVDGIFVRKWSEREIGADGKELINIIEYYDETHPFYYRIIGDGEPVIVSEDEYDEFMEKTYEFMEFDFKPLF